MTAAAPTQVLSSRLPATPEQVWARVQHSGFIGDYLGARLPPVALLAGSQLEGTGRDGLPMTITVVEALAPFSLWLRLAAGHTHSGLRVSIAPCAEGSRLTLVHEAAPTRSQPQPQAQAQAQAQAQNLARRLASSPPAVDGLATALADAAALAAARSYLADTATLVDELRHTMAPRQGYQLPAAGGFSLVQHLWHLADVEQFGWAQRFTRLLIEDQPVLPGVDGDRLAIERRYQLRPWRAAAARFSRQRRCTLAALARCDAATLQRAVHFSGQRTTGAEMLAALLAHDHEHRGEMAALWPPKPLQEGASA